MSGCLLQGGSLSTGRAWLLQCLWPLPGLRCWNQLGVAVSTVPKGAEEGAGPGFEMYCCDLFRKPGTQSYDKEKTIINLPVGPRYPATIGVWLLADPTPVPPCTCAVAY